MLETMGPISLLPVVIAIILAITTKNTIISLITACIVGSFVAGKGIFGFTDLIQSALGNTDFIWALLCVIPFGILVAYYQKSGAIEGVTEYMKNKKLGRKGVQLVAWVLGIFCFADSLSPLFVGTTMHKMADKMRVSREKMAYIADSTGACVSVLYPFTGWSSYLASLAVGAGCLSTVQEAQNVMLQAIPLDFYAILSVALVGLIASGLMKDFGPMRKAEVRAMTEGKLLGDNAEPLVSREIADMRKSDSIKTRVFLNFVFPTLLLFALSIGSFFVLGSVMVVEAVAFVVIMMSVLFLFQGMSLRELNQTFMDGVKGTVPTVMILAFAYCLNALSSEMGTANFIINCTQSFLTPQLLPAVIFLVAAIISFSTGTSWGTFAICMPLALPMAFSITGGEVTLLVLASFAAVAGGGTFGDHCSPLSDTTIMSSMGAASDHIDHVKTQLPYAFLCAGIATVLYLAIGIFAA